MTSTTGPASVTDIQKMIGSPMSTFLNALKGKGKGKGKKGKADKAKPPGKGKAKGRDKDKGSDFLVELPKSTKCEFFQIGKCNYEAQCQYEHAKCSVAKAHLEWRQAVQAKRLARKGKGDEQ